MSRGYLFDKNYIVEENNIKKFLKLDKIYYDYLIKNKLDLQGLDNLYALQKYNIKPSKKDLEFIESFNSVLASNYIFKIIKYKSLKNYYFKILKDSNHLRDYLDYLDNAKVLKYDLTNTKYLKPKNIKVAHDMAYMKVQSIKNKILYNAVKKKCKQYLKLSYEGKKYSIVMPEKAEDIVQEGIDNHNCVGSYLGRVKTGDSIICFVRHSKSKDKSFYTLELDPKTLKVVQCRAYSNGTTPEETKVQNFVKKWRSEVVLKKMKI